MKFKSFKTPENLTKNLCDLLSSEFKEPHNIMLSGGSTPYKIYNQIAKKNHMKFSTLGLAKGLVF